MKTELRFRIAYKCDKGYHASGTFATHATGIRGCLTTAVIEHAATCVPPFSSGTHWMPRKHYRGLLLKPWRFLNLKIDLTEVEPDTTLFMEEVSAAC